VARLSLSALTFLAFVGLAVASMPVYALLGRRPDPDASRRGSRFLMGVGDFLVHWFMWFIGPVERLSLRLGLSPDFFNFAGLAFGLLAGVFIGAGNLPLGAWMLTCTSVCDILDGRIARATASTSDYGGFLDSTLDRFVESFAFIGFAVYLRHLPLGPAVATAALAGSLLVSYARARGESLGVLCKEGLMQRAERLVLMILACLLDALVVSVTHHQRGRLVFWTMVLIAVGTFVTAVHRTAWISLRLREKGRTPAPPSAPAP
jgi:CDP-diacylglycerol--glycerol-3-phosphate 3-phosphatidyltransferase